METTLIEKLKLACNQFYLAKDLDKPLISDEEFDKLRKEYEATNGSVKQLIDWEFDIEMENEVMDPLDKEIAGDNDLTSYVKDHIDQNEVKTHYLNYKYDGSSIKAYYKNGILQKILGTPDVSFGFVRTKSFWNLFPHEVDKDIKSLQGEVLVDASIYGQLARNKANGLTNSKYKEDEVDSEAFIRVYKVNYVDNNWSLDRQINTLSNLPVIERVRLRNTSTTEIPILTKCTDVVFSSANQFDFMDCPKEAIISEGPVKFQVDGVVLYSDAEIKGFKFYYTESAVTTVKEVEWIHQINGSFVPKLLIDGIVLNEKYISRVASGGFPNLKYNKMGRGAKVRVILANMTIPKVIEVIEPSEDYQFPTCECSHKLSENDLCGASLKCGNTTTACDYKVVTWYKILINSLLSDETLCTDGVMHTNEITFDQFFRKEFHWFMDQLYVDRWSSAGKCKVNEDNELNKLIDNILDLIDSQDVTEFQNVLDSNWVFTELNWFCVITNSISWLSIMKKCKDNWSNINQLYFDKLCLENP